MTSGFADFFGIGINHYPRWRKEDGARDLDCAAWDCWRLAYALEDAGVLHSGIVLTDETEDERRRRNIGRTSHKKKATQIERNAIRDLSETQRPLRGEIYRCMKIFLAEQGANRPKIFFFAGHGFSLKGDLQMCCADFDWLIRDKCGISISEVILDFSLKSPWSVFIFDCCRFALEADEATFLARGTQSGGGVLRNGGMFVRDNSIVMMSCSDGEYSYEDASVRGDDEDGGIFTHYLCAALSRQLVGKAQGSKALLSDIFEYARDATSQRVAAYHNKRQTPKMLGAQGVDFSLVRLRS